MNLKTTLFCIPILATVGAVIALVACSSDSDSPPSGNLDSRAAAVAGAVDTHCGARSVTLSEAACKAGTPAEGEDAGDEGSTDADGGAVADNDDYGPTEFNS